MPKRGRMLTPMSATVHPYRCPVPSFALLVVPIKLEMEAALPTHPPQSYLSLSSRRGLLRLTRHPNHTIMATCGSPLPSVAQVWRSLVHHLWHTLGILVLSTNLRLRLGTSLPFYHTLAYPMPLIITRTLYRYLLHFQVIFHTAMKDIPVGLPQRFPRSLIILTSRLLHTFLFLLGILVLAAR